MNEVMYPVVRMSGYFSLYLPTKLVKTFRIDKNTPFTITEEDGKLTLQQQFSPAKPDEKVISIGVLK